MVLAIFKVKRLLRPRILKPPPIQNQRREYQDHWDRRHLLPWRHKNARASKGGHWSHRFISSLAGMLGFLFTIAANIFGGYVSFEQLNNSWLEK